MTNNKQTAIKAKKYLMTKDSTFRDLTAGARKQVCLYFLDKYSVAVDTRKFDMIKLDSDTPQSILTKLPSTDIKITKREIEELLPYITLIEIKSTSKDLDKDFKGFFFGITYDEVIVAQKLEAKGRYLIAFVNEKKNIYHLWDWSETLSHVRKMYMQFSLTF